MCVRKTFPNRTGIYSYYIFVTRNVKEILFLWKKILKRKQKISEDRERVRSESYDTINMISNHCIFAI